MWLRDWSKVVLWFAVFGIRRVQACETLTVEASGFAPVAGTYVSTDTISGRRAYIGPNGAVLRYELTDADEQQEGEELNWGAQHWLKDDGWYVIQDGKHRFGLVSTATISRLSQLSSSWEAQEGAVGPITVTCSECMSTPNWASGIDCAQSGATEDDGCVPEGWTCKAYATRQWCSNGAVVSGQEAMVGSGNQFPEKHCCVCGGAWEPTMDDVLEQLNESQTSVKNLEDAVAQMHSRFSTAEQALVNVSKRASQARQGVIALENESLFNEHQLANITAFWARTRADVDLEQQDLNRSASRAADLLTLTDEANGDADEVAAAQTELEYLNRRIWEAADVKGNASVDVALGRMHEVERETDTFDGRLRTRIRDLTARRYRTGANQVRRALRGFSRDLTTPFI